MPRKVQPLLRGAVMIVTGILAGSVLALYILDHKSRTAKVLIGRKILRRSEPYPGASSMPGSKR